MASHPKIEQIGTFLLVLAVSAQGFQLVAAQGDRQARALGTGAVALLAFLIGLRSGRPLFQRERIGSVGWLPKKGKVIVHKDADGNRHALVTQNSGQMISILIPPEIRDEDVHLHVLIQLNEERWRQRRRD